MSVGPVRQGTVSSDLQQLAAALLARQRQPVQILENRKKQLSERSSVLGALRTRLTALRSALDTLGGIGTLSPFAAKAATSSDAALLGASAAANAATGTLAVTVGQLARRATHASDLYGDAGTAISGAGPGTFAFTVTVAATAYDVSVDVGAGDTDQTVLDNLAAAITAAVGAKGSAVRIQTETGKSRLSVASAATGTANKIAFADTDGLLARIGLVRGSPTAATDTAGGYVYEDLGNHELDARLVVDGLTYYRDSNAVSDLMPGVTLNLKGTSAAAVNITVQPDADNGLAKIKDFIAKYNDVLDYLAQNTFVDPKANRRGVLSLEVGYSDLAARLRLTAAARVVSQTSGKPDTLAVLGVAPGSDGKLSIKNEAALRDTLVNDPGAVIALFSATDGVATQLEAFVDGYAKASGQITASQRQITTRIGGLDSQIKRANEALARRQAVLEDQLARSQALLQQLARQAAQVSAYTQGLALG